MAKLARPQVQTASSTGDWQAQLERVFNSCSPSAKLGLVGIGHPLRGDDYVGSFIAKSIMSARPGKLRGGSYVFDFEDNVEGSISELAGFRFRNIVFMDSCEMGLEPGQVSVRPIADTSYPFFTTHGIPLRILAEQLLSGSQVWILAIQPKQTGFGESLSTEVRSTAIAISEFIATDLTDGGPAYAG